jgi:polyisoprenyl-phosphate glycosyltransferase
MHFPDLSESVFFSTFEIVCIMKLSVIIPVYNGAQTIGPLVMELEKELISDYDLEVVLVNDGSPHDNSAEVCEAIARRNKHIKSIDLSRNFGEHNAVLAGLNYCTGEAAVIIDDDFQNPPAEIAKLVDKLQEGFDVVFSAYQIKHHGLLRNLGSRLNNLVASLLLQKKNDLYLSSFKAINRFVIDHLIQYTGPFPYIDGLIIRVTQNYASVLVQHSPRSSGRSGYTLIKLISLWLNMFTNFSILPLRFATFLGFFSALAGAISAVIFAIEKLRNPGLPVGWASLVVSLLVTSGIQLFTVGMIGEYLGRLFLTTNGKPQFVVRRTVNCESSDAVTHRS